MPELTVIILVLVLLVAIQVAIIRWVLRINVIVKRLDRLIELMEGKQDKDIEG